jgi:hypothetical protein
MDKRQAAFGGELSFFGSAQELVSLDCRDHADGTFVARLGALYAPKAAYANWARESDFVRQCQQDLNR